MFLKKRTIAHLFSGINYNMYINFMSISIYY